MGQVTVSPDATTSNTGAVTGAASAHAALADDSDSSYVTFDLLEDVELTFADPTVPSGAKVISSLLVARWARVGTGTLQAAVFLTVDSQMRNQLIAISSGSAANVFAAAVLGDWDPDDASCRIIAAAGDSSPDLRLYKVSLVVTYVAKPTVTVNSPSGTLTTTKTPKIEWTPDLDSHGGGQTKWQVKIFADSVYGAGGFDPALSTQALASTTIQSGADTSWDQYGALIDDTYKAYVRVGQTVNGETFWSEWTAGSAFTIDTPFPAIDTFTATGQEDNGRIKLTITADSGATADTDWFEVQRRYSTSDDWEPLRTVEGDGKVLTAETAYDREAPNATTAYYRARAVHDNGDDTVINGDWETASASWFSDQEWLRHPTDPDLDAKITLRSFQGHTRSARQSIEQPLGRSDAVVLSDTREPESGSMVIACADDDERDAIMALATTGDPLLLNLGQSDHEPCRWIALGDEQVERKIDHAWSAERDITYDWREVGRPGGNLTSWEAA